MSSPESPAAASTVRAQRAEKVVDRPEVEEGAAAEATHRSDSPPSSASRPPRAPRPTPAAFVENAGKTIAFGPTRKHGAFTPAARRAG